MLLASALGFVKLLALAYVLPSDEFGRYVTYFGVASFVSVFVSFGLNEKTIKDYPRRWAVGDRKSILNDAIKAEGILGVRFLIIGTIALGISYFDLINIGPQAIILMTILALSTSLLTLIASLYRAVGSQLKLQNFTLLRSVGVFSFAMAGGSLLGWQGAIAGDTLGGVIGLGFSLWQLPSLCRDQPSLVSKTSGLSATENGHYQIYFANLVVAPQSMLDKAWISNIIGPVFAGSYGVVMLIPQVVQLLANVVVQHIGPLVIKLVHLDQSTTHRQNTIAFNAAMLGAFSLVLTATALLAKRIPYLNHLFIKYEISDFSLVMVGVIACSQIYGLIEFHLIARDREQDILKASIASFIIFIISFSLAAEFKAGVEWFLAGIGAARWGQVWLLRRAYLRYA